MSSESVFLTPSSYLKPFLGNRLLEVSIGRGFGALKGLSSESEEHLRKKSGAPLPWPASPICEKSEKWLIFLCYNSRCNLTEEFHRHSTTTRGERIHPMTQLNITNSHAPGTPESRPCSWFNPLSRKCSRSCVLVMVVCRQPLDYGVAPSSKHASPPPRPDPVVSYMATPWSYPTHACWLRRWTSAVAASRTTSPTVRLRTGRPMFLFALLVPYFDNTTPISIKLEWFCY